MNKIIYKVVNHLGDGYSILGYATGDKVDIHAAFKDKMVYALDIVPITIKHIPKGYSTTQQAKQDRIQQLEKELIELKKKFGLILTNHYAERKFMGERPKIRGDPLTKIF